MKKVNNSESDSSGHGLSENGDSTDTEGPQNESDVNEENSLDENDYSLENEKQRLRLEKLPKCLHVGRQIAEECNVDVERHNARLFAKTIRSDLIPMVSVLRSNIQVDEAFQSFASEYCQGKVVVKYQYVSSLINTFKPLIQFILFTAVFAEQQKLQAQGDTSVDTCALITIMNADGIYLAIYAALLLNLKLIKINYYNDDTRQVPISEVGFPHL